VGCSGGDDIRKIYRDSETIELVIAINDDQTTTSCGGR
jgi:hypothetical protein